MVCGMMMIPRSPAITPWSRSILACKRARRLNSPKVTVSRSSSSIQAVTNGRSPGAAASASMRLLNCVTLPVIVSGDRTGISHADHTNQFLAACERAYARGPRIRNNALQSETVLITQVTNVASRNPVRPGVSALHCGLCESPLASSTTSCSADRLLRTLFHLGRLVRGCSSRVNGDELPVGKMAPAKAFRTRSVDRHSTEPGAARQLQVPPGNRGKHSAVFVAKVLASCIAIRDLVLDFPGDELPVRPLSW